MKPPNPWSKIQNAVANGEIERANLQTLEGYWSEMMTTNYVPPPQADRWKERIRERIQELREENSKKQAFRQNEELNQKSLTSAHQMHAESNKLSEESLKISKISVAKANTANLIAVVALIVSGGSAMLALLSFLNSPETQFREPQKTEQITPLQSPDLSAPIPTSSEPKIATVPTNLQPVEENQGTNAQRESP